MVPRDSMMARGTLSSENPWTSEDLILEKEQVYKEKLIFTEVTELQRRLAMLNAESDFVFLQLKCKWNEFQYCLLVQS